jgi:hypothetical protein
MAGVQVMPAVGAVDVGLGRRRVAAASRSGAGLFVGDSRRRSRRPAACSVRLRQGRGRRGGLAIVCNLGGTYEDDFSDVDKVIYCLPYAPHQHLENIFGEFLGTSLEIISVPRRKIRMIFCSSCTASARLKTSFYSVYIFFFLDVNEQN